MHPLRFANKVDVPGAVTESSLVASMKLEDLALSRNTVVRGVAKMGEGGSPHASVSLALEWLLKSIGGDHHQLNERRAREMEEHKVAEGKRREEQRAKFAASQAALASTSASSLESSSQHVTVAPTSADGQLQQKEVAPPVSKTLWCSRCPTVPASRRCAASKWEAVCEACALSLEAAAAATLVVDAEEEEEEKEKALTQHRSPAELSSATERAGAAANAAAASATTTSAFLEPATPSKIRMETVSVPSTPTVGGEDGESTVTSVTTLYPVRSPLSLGLASMMEEVVESPSTAPPSSPPMEASVSASSFSPCKDDNGTEIPTPRSRSRSRSLAASVLLISSSSRKWATLCKVRQWGGCEEM